MLRELLGEGLVLRRHLGGGVEVIGQLLPPLVGIHDPAEFGVAPVDLLRSGRVGVEFRISQLFL